jgi:hypothetical protein
LLPSEPKTVKGRKKGVLADRTKKSAPLTHIAENGVVRDYSYLKNSGGGVKLILQWLVPAAGFLVCVVLTLVAVRAFGGRVKRRAVRTGSGLDAGSHVSRGDTARPALFGLGLSILPMSSAKGCITRFREEEIEISPPAGSIVVTSGSSEGPGGGKELPRFGSTGSRLRIHN